MGRGRRVVVDEQMRPLERAHCPQRLACKAIVVSEDVTIARATEIGSALLHVRVLRLGWHVPR
jgi:hypothetical protein